MNDILVWFGIESWKPAVEAALMPPVPLLLMVLIGARLMYRRRLLAWSLVLLGTLGTWLMSTVMVAAALSSVLLMPPRVLSPSEIGELKKAQRTAIVVLGAGRRLISPEYGVSNLKPFSIERLRYGLWLSRETGLPAMYSGGVGWGADAGPSEAEIAVRISEREFGRPLRWTEGQSRDTNENALRTLQLLKDEHIDRIIVVTHGFHMRRAMAAFARASQRLDIKMEFQAAPMGGGGTYHLHPGDWLPSPEGFEGTRLALHEWVGRLMGA